MSEMSQVQVVEQTYVTTTESKSKEESVREESVREESVKEESVREESVREESVVEENSLHEEEAAVVETEQTTSAHTGTAEKSGTTSHNEASTAYDESDEHFVGGNSEAVSISSSKLQESYSHHLKEKPSTIQISTNMNNFTQNELLEKFGQCTECNQPNTGMNWCQSCNSEHFRSRFGEWTSGNPNIDKVIKDSQLFAKDNKYVLEWIPYDRFKDVKYVAKGGFGTVYSAYWMDGHVLEWDKKLDRWKRHGNDMVALKRLHNSQFITKEFLDQIVRAHLRLHDNERIIQYYGISRYPETEDFMIVMEYANQGSIRSYLNGRFNTMNWYGKVEILSNIAQGLEWIHDSGYVHYNLHVGNVLRTGTGQTIITDIGIKKPTIKFTAVLREKDEIYGVLPYLAPEVLYSKKFTSASDVYSFGILMNEIITGLPPFNSVAHDRQLAVEICQGKRPEIQVNAPKLLQDLIKRCWETKPSNRPSAKELKDLITKWWDELQNNQSSEISSQCKASEELSRNSATFTPTPLLYVSHPETVYHSRLLEFNKLPRPVVNNTRSKISSSLPYSESRQIDPAVYEDEDDDYNENASSCICPFNTVIDWLNSYLRKNNKK